MHKLKVIGLSLFLALLVSTGCQTTADATVIVHFIDVGQGDSILIDAGETEVLIDGGDKNTGAAEYIEAYLDGALEAVIATHPDSDHIGGLISVFNKYDVTEFWYNGQTSGSKTCTDLMTLVNAESAIREVERGDEIRVAALTFSVLHPAKPLGSDTNENSIVLALRYGETDFLFMGDAGHAAEADMLDIIRDIDILKVGHHGSKYSSSPEFLNIVKPEVAVYMAGGEYGHPHQETLLALDAIDAVVYGTDNCGTIKVSTDGVEYEVSTER